MWPIQHNQAHSPEAERAEEVVVVVREQPQEVVAVKGQKWVAVVAKVAAAMVGVGAAAAMGCRPAVVVMVGAWEVVVGA
jgi:hypothetical protein